jgi:hypothetical protein
MIKRPNIRFVKIEKVVGIHMRALKKGLSRRKRKQNVFVPAKEHPAQLEDG